MIRFHPTSAALAVSTLLLTTACMASTSADIVPGSGAATGSQSKSPGGGSSDVAKLGDKYSYDDGLQVEITKAKSGKLDQFGAGAKPGSAIVLLTVRVTNGTGQKFDTALTLVSVSYGNDGDQADAVFDSENNIDSALQGTIAKGKSKSAVYGFAVPRKQQSDVTVEVTPDFNHDPAIFEGAVK